ncbi:LOG family protein [Candidatus Gracilibacteria bacterium]|nr:LOG family protein [Candidatus Gracilibacteria bacterium]MCF7819116.1 LOG family protein [Candidatus Gracilibacteria bacterium]
MNEKDESCSKLVIQRSEIKELEEREERLITELTEVTKQLREIQLKRFFRTAIFGSARLPEGSPEYEHIRQVSRALTELFQSDIVTGGGPGAMDAANKGVIDIVRINSNGSSPKSHGETIHLPGLEEDKNENLHFHTKHLDFVTRLRAFMMKIHAAYNAPGGLGTALEKFFFLQLKQVKHIDADFPIICHPFWEPFLEKAYEIMHDTRQKEGLKELISEKDKDLVQFSSNPDEIVAIIEPAYKKFQKERENLVIKE